MPAGGIWENKEVQINKLRGAKASTRCVLYNEHTDTDVQQFKAHKTLSISISMRMPTERIGTYLLDPPTFKMATFFSPVPRWRVRDVPQ